MDRYLSAGIHLGEVWGGGLLTLLATIPGEMWLIYFIYIGCKLCHTPKYIHKLTCALCQLFCSADSIPVRNATFGGRSGSILLDNLMCNGSEYSLLDCVGSEDIGSHNCDHSEDAGVRCEGTLHTLTQL